jgi:hypothetical protein
MSPTAPTLPVGNQLGFSYEYGVDIDLGVPGSPVWQPIRRPSAIKPTMKPITSSGATYDDFGAPNDQRISESWDLSFSVLVNRLASTGLYPDEIEKLKSYTEPDALGALAVAHVRWYDKPAAGIANPAEAYEGYAFVTIERANVGNADAGVFNVTMTGQGKRIKIANPFAGWGAAAPTVTAATPAGAAVGALVTITGTNFTTATSVKFLAVSATVFTIVGGSSIVAVMPAGVAGSAPVTVINPTGTSNALPYTRGA